jgi:hypothetical protein
LDADRGVRAASQTGGGSSRRGRHFDVLWRESRWAR